MQKLFEKSVKLEFLGLLELSLYSCFHGQAKDILNELLIVSAGGDTLKKLKLHLDNVLSGIDDDNQQSTGNDLSQIWKLIGKCTQL